MATKAALYRPLDASRSEIRLLEILGGDELDDDGTMVRCRLSTVSLDDNPDFCALSYVWGDATVTAPISVEAPSFSGDGQVDTDSAVVVEVQATIKLAASLRKVRAGGSRYLKANPAAFRLWVDAVCINQADPAERQHQVLLMRRVYKSARLVIGWLGNTDFSTAFQAIKTISWEMSQSSTDDEFDSLEWMKPYPEFCGYDLPTTVTIQSVREATLAGREIRIVLPESITWENVQRLLYSPYWERVWTLQEMVLANSFVFLTQGAGWISLRLLSNVAVRMADLKRFLQGRSVPRPQWISYHSWDYLTDEETLGWPVVYLCRPPWKMGRMGSGSCSSEWEDVDTQEERPSVTAWVGALFSCTRLKASDPRDQIYGLLGVYDLGIVPDYSGATSLTQLYLEFAKGWLHVLLQTSSRDSVRARQLPSPLFFLHTAGTGRGSDPLVFPSWVPDLHFHANNFWRKFLPRDIESKTISPRQDGAWPNVVHNSLLVRGVEVDVVETVHLPFSVERGNMTLVWLVSAYLSRIPKYPTGLTVHEAFLRLFFKDDDISSSEKSSVYKALGFIHMLHYLFTTSSQEYSDDLLPFFSLLGWDDEKDELDSFNSWFTRRFFPRMSLESLGFDANLLGLWSPQAPGFEDLINGPGAIAAQEFDDSWSIFETANGYIGLAPPAAKRGDHVYLLDHGDAPVILRELSAGDKSHHTLVGTSFVVGVMNRVVEDFTTPSKPAERLEIR